MKSIAAPAKDPLVSIGLPVHNGEDFVREAIGSILAQDLADFELIISDNASTDRTGEICRQWASRDPRVRYHRSDVNRGLPRNFNRAFELARGRYFLWVSHDDRLGKDYLRRCVEALERDPGSVLCFANSESIDGSGRVIRGVRHSNDGTWSRPHKRYRSIMRLDHKCDAICGLMRAAALRETRLHGAFADSDRVLLAELGLRGRFHLIPEFLFQRREHPLQVTARFPGRQDRTSVFNPGQAGRICFPHLREAVELSAAVRRARLPLGERLRCRLHLLGWLWTNRSRLRGDLRSGLRSFASRIIRRAPPRARSSPRVGLLGHFGFGNLGDEAVVQVLIAKVRESFPGAEICAFSLNPRDTERRHGIPAFPIRRASETEDLFEGKHGRGEAPRSGPGRKGWKDLVKRIPLLSAPLRALRSLMAPPAALLAEVSFLWRSRRRLQGLQVLVVPGSGQLNDFWGGPFRHPYTLLSFGLLARVSRVPLVVLSVGAGQLDTFLGKLFCKLFLALTSYRSFRDRQSRELMGLGRSNGRAPVFPDQGFGLIEVLGLAPPPPGAVGARPAGENGSRPLVVGLNLVSRPYHLPPGADEAPQRNYLETLASFLAWLIQNGHRIRSCPSDPGHDVPVLAQLKGLLARSHGIRDFRTAVIETPIHGVEELIEQIRLSDLVVASRYHGVVLPLALEIPVLGIAYSGKIRNLLCDVGQGDYCLDLKGLRLEDLKERFQALLANRDSIRARIRAEVPRYLTALRDQHREVFSRIPRT